MKPWWFMIALLAGCGGEPEEREQVTACAQQIGAPVVPCDWSG